MGSRQRATQNKPTGLHQIASDPTGKAPAHLLSNGEYRSRTWPNLFVHDTEEAVQWGHDNAPSRT